ncbi:hypothetical protein J2X31_002505 [Flavobacterium arsenatis]|uniref:Uncharacterized protein n=1 Tax=Flavobacterium arsenatis TaxID=1484332 RepID=A0ABU1TRI5_9FLAO|nr:hypothetical protein [Flavobacterium arsenatis]MDR6968482.1 hypothetical protein [Flavobacterium arsenatis]
MKSITTLVLALVAFSNVTLASTSESKANKNLTSIETLQKNSEVILSKFKKVKSVESEQLSPEVENFKHQKTIDEVIAEDLKVIESNPFETEFSEIESLKRQQTVEETITENLKIIEGTDAL